MTKVKINTEVELTEDFVGDILVTAFDGNYGGSLFWANWSRRADALQTITNRPDHTGFLDVWEAVWIKFNVEESCSGMMKRVYEAMMTKGGLKIDADMVAAGIMVAMSKGSASIQKSLLLALAEQDASSIDSGLADSIIQFAVFGEQVYG